jgi:DNA primase
LVESIGDMLALYDAGIYNVLVTFGVYLGPAIIKFLLQMDVDRIVIALNDDREKKSVGNKAAAKMRQLLLNYFDERQVSINLPLKKDFGVMKRDEILLWKTQSQI